MMKIKYGICLMMIMSMISGAQAQYAGWKGAGIFYILTTPEGADLPATTSEENFPLLVRLNKEWFDFSQAKPKGDDLRFSADNKPLAYQIEEWDATAGTASIWVRVSVIKGNARQELKMFWGKPDAASESNGKAVFNESNGYLTVMHLSDPVNAVKDEVGTLAPTNFGATASSGIIGKSLNFVYGRPSVVCGENIMNFPQGNSASSTELWFKDNKLPGPWGSRFVCWGREDGGSKLLIGVLSPLHIQAGLDCEGPVALGQWYHVVHTYETNGTQKVYVNGRLSASGVKPLNFKTPARMYIGNWYRNWESDCDVDEVRVSKVTRSADWVKMEYENQKPSQTMVGLLPQTGNAFSVSPAAITVDEGKSVIVTAQAGGAQKIYWLLKRDGAESVVAVDQFSYTFDAGRVTADTACMLQFKAVYSSGVKVKDIPVTIKEAIPEPVFTLSPPSRWDGRQTVELLPRISNLKEMQAKGAGVLKYDWTVSGMGVIKEIAPDRLVLKRSQNSGTLNVKLVLSNGGTPAEQTIQIAVKEPTKDAWVERIPAKDEKPVDNQFYSRDDKNEGTLFYNGTLEEVADTVFLRLYSDDKLIKTEKQKPGADKSYSFTLKLKPGLIKYKVEFGTKSGAGEKILRTVGNLVCGDAYLIDGQSNALATDTREESPRDTNDWIRSYGRPEGDPKGPSKNLWCNPVWKAAKPEHKAQLGWWGMELAKRLVESQKVPIFIVNSAVGGTRIDQHQRSDANPEDWNTIYGRMLWRVRQAKLTHGIRAVIWHQGENDQGSAGPTGKFGWETYHEYFADMAAAWKQDFPNIQHYYVFQIWPNSCAMGGKFGSGDMLREKQRTLPYLYSNMSMLSTLGIRPPGSAHYPLEGWAVFARLLQPIIEKEIYGKVPSGPVTAPNLKSVKYTGSTGDKIALEFDQPVIWSDKLVSEFYLDGEKGKVASGTVSGNVLTLKLQGPSSAKKITYIKEIAWSQDNLLNGANGIAALTFANVPIEK
jgi:hypothetical protein